MKKLIITLGVALMIISFAAAMPACKGSNKTLVKVGNKKITEADLDVLVEANPQLKMRMATPQGKRQLLEKFAEHVMLYDESIKRGVHRKESVRNKIRLSEKFIVAKALLDDALEKAVKKYYEEHHDEFERVKVAHINVRFKADNTDDQKPNQKKAKKKDANEVTRTEKQALAVIEKVKARLNAGEDFAKLADEFSEDKRTQKTGGDLGYLTLSDKKLERHGWQALVEKAFAMNAGDASDPIKSQNSYHIIKILEGKNIQPFDEVSRQIEFKIGNTTSNTTLAELKEKYKITFPEDEAKKKEAVGEKTEEAKPEGEGAPDAEGTPGPQGEEAAGVKKSQQMIMEKVKETMKKPAEEKSATATKAN